MTEHELERFMGKVEGSGEECWEWQGATTLNGYGIFYLDGCRSAHRTSYQHFVAPIEGEIHHICENKLCMNPTHLRDVTRSQHSRAHPLRGPAAENAAGTRCKHGHEYSEENLFVDSRGSRGCRECRRRWSREYERRKRAKCAAINFNAMGES